MRTLLSSSSARGTLLAAIVLPSTVLSSTVLSSTPAYADENVCRDVYEQSQELMKPKAESSSLIPAREKLRTCMRSNCKDWIVADCSKWLGEVESRIPTVVFSARDTAGRDLTEVQVASEKGASIAARLDGRAIEMEPGVQTFVFTLPDGARREKKVLVREGEKSQSVAALFDAPPGVAPVPSTTPEGASREPAPSSTLRYVGYGAAGLGVVGLGLGAIFGLQAINAKSNARCDDTGACDDGAALDDANGAASMATVGVVAGGVLLAAGVALILLTPSSSAAASRSARLGRTFGLSTTGFGARW